MNSDEATSDMANAGRELLVGAAGALSAVAAGSLARGTPAQATQGSAVLEGRDTVGATARTAVFTTGTARTAVFTASSTGFGILADPNTSGEGSIGSTATATPSAW